jgi:hypothetical protein
MLRVAVLLTELLAASIASAATLSQTVHFPGGKAADLFCLYMTGAGQERITGLPAQYLNAKGEPVERGSVGDTLQAFCFEPGKCGLDAKVVAVDESPGAYTVVMSWWNFGWVSAVDPADYTVEQRGAPASTLVLTFRDTLAGAQVELVQVNVPDYKVVIPNPDGSKETGPLSRIVNTHWNTLYWDGVRRFVAAQ